MPSEPGNLNHLGPAGQKDWAGLLEKEFADADSPHLVASPNQRTSISTTVDWGAYPVRIRACLSTDQADRLLDWTKPSGDQGRLRFQEEYLEWRVVRDKKDRIIRVEMTTELPDYWEILAAHHPDKTLALVKDFAGEEPEVKDVYGSLDPFSKQATPAKRKAAFKEKMRGGLGDWSPYNNGKKGLCFMSQGANNLQAAVQLVGKASFPLVTTDPVTGRERVLTGPEAIATRSQAAQACRNSDPTIVGACIGLAAEGRVFAIDDPIGIYIIGVANTTLRKPDGSAVPKGWFRSSRSKNSLSQRLVFQVPKQASGDLTISDLIDSTNNEEIRFGGQIARLVQLGVNLKMSNPDAVEPKRKAFALPTVRPCEKDLGCEEIRDSWSEFQGEG